MVRSNSKEKVLDEVKQLISHKNPKDNKKAKKLAMKNNIKLGELRKNFCQECFFPLDDAHVRIKNKKKVVKCNNCEKVFRWVLKN